MFRMFDIFGSTRGMAFDGYLSHKTTIGFIATMLFLLGAVLSVFYYYQLFKTREKRPKILIEEFNLPIAPRLNILENDFFFTFTGFYKGSWIQPDQLTKILNFRVHQVTAKIGENNKFKFEKTQVGIRKCNESDFTINDKFIINKPEKSSSRYSLCSKSQDLNIDDDYVINGSQTIEIQIFPCSVNCRPDFIEILESGKLRIILGHSESSQDLDNLHDPFNFNYNTNRWFHILKKKTFSRKLYISKTTIITNKGIFKNDIF